jgi:hypothetical protein
MCLSLHQLAILFCPLGKFYIELSFSIDFFWVQMCTHNVPYCAIAKNLLILSSATNVLVLVQKFADNKLDTVVIHAERLTG